MLTEFRYLPFSSSTFFFNVSIFSRSTKNESSGLGPEAFRVSWDFFSNLFSKLRSFSSLFSSREDLFCSLRSSSCCNTMEWMTDMKLLMASEAALSGNLSTASCHSSQRAQISDVELVGELFGRKSVRLDNGFPHDYDILILGYDMIFLPVLQ
eukprot:TRINITY_DN7150_c0_g1_i1.p1 TRINITY_DN7150_c0_g1~~TRINITY_DN7150_c0_g1_i1.p1  ORF type:complete len:153 (-),score=19.34 TRINITY_DN7150_c0_g1_i1:578-1036(-)